MYIGIDGCKFGWVAVVIDEGIDLIVCGSIHELYDLISSAKVVFIDMPIGLPSFASPVRLCDIEARRLLSPKRHSSVFSAPPRPLLSCKTYEEANKLSKVNTTKGISKQSWYLFRKIREVDTFLLHNKKHKNILLEAHPECCFYGLQGNVMKHTKRTKLGIQERLAVLKEYVENAPALIEEWLSLSLRKDVAVDDLVDAFCLAIAALYSQQSLIRLPTIEQRDQRGLPMHIHFSAPETKRLKKF